MRFYVMHDLDGETLGCETSLARAKANGRERSPGAFYVTRLDVLVTSETIRILLAQRGCYAAYVEKVYEEKPPDEA